MAVIKSIVKLFEKSGNVGPQPNLLKLLKKHYVESTSDEFITPFLEALMSVIISPTNIHCVVVNNMIKFAANGVSVLCEHSTTDGRNGLYLISEMFRFCRKYGYSSEKTIRWRFCSFFNHLFNYVSDGDVLSLELCEVATLLLLNRLQDKQPEVRAQAAYALHRLQSTDYSKCKIIKKFELHMTSDPSTEVRIAIVKIICMFNHVIENMLTYTIRDISENVRKEAYNRFLGYPFLSFTSKQIQSILENGLEDKNESIKSLIKKRLLIKWLNECENNYTVFLKKLGVENEPLCERILNIMFESCYDCQILDLINSILNSETRMIDYDKLTLENIFLWKCIAKYLTIEKKIELARSQGHFDDDYIEVLLPDLVKFSDYIRGYYFRYHYKGNKEFILTQLLDMARLFSIDDVGADSLNKLCSDLILVDNMSIAPIKAIALLLDLTFKSGEDILNYTKQILNEIQSRTIDIYPTINKIGKKEFLKTNLTAFTKKYNEQLKKNKSAKCTHELELKVKNLKLKCQSIDVMPEEVVLVNMAVKNLVKGFEFVFQIQQLPKVGLELSLLTDIIQNIIVGYLECSMIQLQMKAFDSLTPYLLVNDVTAAKTHVINLCDLIVNPAADKHKLFKILFELIMRYGLKTFNMNENLDSDEEDNEYFASDKILPLLVNSIDYEVDDNSFKSVIVKEFCNLLIFEKIKSIKLLSKLFIIWFKRLSCDSFNLSNYLVQFFTSYVFYFRSSSSTLAKCYVPILKEIDEQDLINNLGINLKEMNSTLINTTRGLMYRNEKLSINAHGELAGYIFDYLLDEDQPYTAMLIDTLHKLEIDFEDDQVINELSPKLRHVIKHLKQLDDDRSKIRYLKKINLKFDPILQKKNFTKKMDTNIVNDIQTKEETQVSTDNIQKLDPIEEVKDSQTPSTSKQEVYPVVQVQNDLFSQESSMTCSSEDEDDLEEAFTRLDAMKRMSENFKQNFNTQTQMRESSSNSD